MADTLPRVYISLASNVNPVQNLQKAVDTLRQRCNVLVVSSVYQSPPFGYTDQPDFLDIVVKLSTPLLPPVFKEMLNKIEVEVGRDRDNQETPHGPLPLDMDILLWGNTAFSFGTKPWRVPDKSIVEEASIAIPLAEVEPDFIHPTEKVPLSEIAARFTHAPVNRRTDVRIT